MTVISSERVIRGKERPDGERRLGLTHEDRGRHVEAFGSARAHHPAHQNGEGAHDELHDAEIIHDGKQRAHEDDRGQELEREDHAQAGVRLAQLAEDELGADVGIVENSGDEAAQRAKQLLTGGNAEDEDGEQELQREPPRHHPPADLPPVVRQGDGDGYQRDDTEQTGEPRAEAQRLMDRREIGLGRLEHLRVTLDLDAVGLSLSHQPADPAPGEPGNHPG